MFVVEFDDIRKTAFPDDIERVSRIIADSKRHFDSHEFQTYRAKEATAQERDTREANTGRRRAQRATRGY